MNEEIVLEEIENHSGESVDRVTQEMKEALAQKLFKAKRDLEKTKSANKQGHLQEQIDDLKMELGWTLLDYKEYEEGLVLLSSVSGRRHGEMKCNGMAQALTEMGHCDEAMELLKRGLRTYPQSYALWTAMGTLYEKLGDDFESLKCFETAFQFAPEDDSITPYNKALALMKVGRPGDAVPILEGLAERYPEEPKYLSDGGVCAMEMGYPQEALQYYQKAMEIWQRNPSTYTGICIYSGLCSSYLGLGMKREGTEIAMEGLKKFPDEDPALYQNAGAAFYDMGWRREAIEILKKGIEKFPEDQDLRQFLKEAEDDLEDPDGVKPPILGLMLLMAMVRKGLWRK